MPDQAPPRPAWQLNTSFSTYLPMQLTIDSTSLGEFKTCPRKYYYRIVEGWVPRHTSVHLQFGLWLHQGREVYERDKSRGADHEEAIRTALKFVLDATWDRELDRPWWSDHKTKNRLTLVRTLVWYLDQYGKDDVLETVQLASGKPAVELSFKMASPYRTVTSDEEINFCGHLDRLAKFNGETYVCDIKTTSSTLGTSYFQQYSPDNQFSLYTLAGRVVFNTPVAGVIVDACQIAVGFSRFERQPIHRTEPQISEWLSETGLWFKVMEQCAVENHWPMNDRACHHYGGCPYRPVCSRPPSARQKWLETDYVKSIWDPSITRES